VLMVAVLCRLDVIFIDFRDNGGKTALQLAISRGHLEVVEVLLMYGANVNLQDDAGNNASDLVTRNLYFSRAIHWTTQLHLYDLIREKDGRAVKSGLSSRSFQAVLLQFLFLSHTFVLYLIFLRHLALEATCSDGVVGRDGGLIFGLLAFACIMHAWLSTPSSMPRALAEEARLHYENKIQAVIDHSVEHVETDLLLSNIPNESLCHVCKIVQDPMLNIRHCKKSGCCVENWQLHSALLNNSVGKHNLFSFGIGILSFTCFCCFFLMSSHGCENFSRLLLLDLLACSIAGCWAIIAHIHVFLAMAKALSKVKLRSGP